MRVITLSATLLATGLAAIALAPSRAAAQSTTTGYPFCLFTGPAQVCAYNSMAQCLAAKRGNADFCQPNNLHAGGGFSRSYGYRPPQ